MIIPIPSDHKRFQVRMKIRALQPFDLGLVAYDPQHVYTHYLRRKIPFTDYHFEKNGGYRDVIVQLPISPKKLNIRLYDKATGDDDIFEMKSFQVEPLAVSQVWAEEEMHQFIDFAMDFCQKAGYCKTGFIHSPDYQFLIQYLPKIQGVLGEELITPARTHRKTGRIQVSQAMFRNFSIPVRMFIMLHERQHYAIPTRKERPADLTALKLYLDLGFPHVEGVYAATKVFTMHDIPAGKSQLDRTHDIKSFIDRYRAEQRRQG